MVSFKRAGTRGQGLSAPAPAAQGVEPMARTATRFDFNVDRVSAQEIAGWAAERGAFQKRVTLQFRLDGVPVGIATTEMVRADVENAGRGGRHSGFVWRIPPQIARAMADDGHAVEILALADAPERLTSVRLSTDPAVNPRVRELMRPQLEQVVTDASLMRLSQDGAKAGQDGPEAPPSFAPHQRMFARKGSAAGAAAALSPYLTFTRHRMRQEHTYPLDGSEDARNAYLRWYLDLYCQRRVPWRAPLGAAEIDYLNQPVPLPGVPFKVSRASLAYAATDEAARDLLPLSDEAAFDRFVAWWGREKAPALHLEDCLVPDDYIARLARVTTSWMGQEFAPSVSMNAVFDRDERFHTLNRFSAADRVVLGVWYLLEMAHRPGMIRYMPAKTLTALLEGEAGATLFDRVVQSAHPQGAALAALFDARTYVDLLSWRGFDITRRRFTARDGAGNRFEAARLPAVPMPAKGPVPLQVVGPFEKSSGLGQASRLSLATLERTGIAFNAVDFDLDNPAPVGMNTAKGRYGKPQRAKVNLIHLNGETVPLAFAYMPDVFSGAYNIGYFFWELSTPAAAQHLALDLLDEIWVASDFGVSIYTGVLDKPVHNVGMAFEPVPAPDRATARAFLADRAAIGPDTFVFLATFDSFSFLERKNPHGLVAAFREAFAGGEDVRLVLKTHNRDFVADRHQAMRWNRVMDAAALDPRIIIMNETLRFNDLITLKKAADCYVSLHRSEGWGFGLIEAMSIGVPCLATGYSGNLAFTNAQTAFLVDHSLVEPESHEYLFVSRGQTWAEPDHAHAVATLRRVFEDDAAREAKAEAGRAYVHAHYSLDAQAKKYRARLDEIFGALV